jgi:pimeloyl-ACP methyl ester carboxylesterase
MKPTRLPVLLSLLCMAASQPVQARINNIILVHGAFTDGSVWQEVIDRLQTRGYRVTAVQNPLTSLKDDVAATERVIDRQQGKWSLSATPGLARSSLRQAITRR